jgi:hypothetical protein
MLTSRQVSLTIHTVGMVCYDIGRMTAFFAMYFTNVGKRLFGSNNFGTLSGFGMFLAAVIRLTQYPLIAVATTTTTSATDHGEFKMADDSIVDLACGCVSLLLLPYCVWLSIPEPK